MVCYYSGSHYLFRCTGSTLPYAAAIALPCGLAAALLHFHLQNVPNYQPPEVQRTMSSVWATITGLLSFMIAFRANQSYSRYWEGVSACQAMQSAWYNVASAIVAFCTILPKNWHEKANFVGLIVRMISLLYATAATDIIDTETARFPVVSCTGISPESLEYLRSRPNKVEVILHWVQRLVVDAAANGVVTVPPPIATRVFSDITRGLEHFNSARKLKENPFPFPYAQAITVLLILQTIGVVAACAIYSETPQTAFLLCFLHVTFFWAINFIAAELEMPFGEDPNDIRLAETVLNMNERLRSLLDRHSQIPPTFDSSLAQNNETACVCWCNEEMTTDFIRILSDARPVPPGQRLGTIKSSSRAGSIATAMTNAVPVSTFPAVPPASDGNADDPMCVVKSLSSRSRETMRESETEHAVVTAALQAQDVTLSNMIGAQQSKDESWKCTRRTDSVECHWQPTEDASTQTRLDAHHIVPEHLEESCLFASPSGTCGSRNAECAYPEPSKGMDQATSSWNAFATVMQEFVLQEDRDRARLGSARPFKSPSLKTSTSQLGVSDVRQANACRSTRDFPRPWDC